MIVLETKHENATLAELWAKDRQYIKELELR
jgi:hypothetical protein